MKPQLTVDALKNEAARFAEEESRHQEPLLFGVTDGKAIGTYLEQKFRLFLLERYESEQGNAAKGIDFPGLDVDMKVTSIKQPQSSCPFKSARQKIYGLGYSVLVFVYEKSDDPKGRTGHLNILHTIFVDSACTADYQTTTGIRQILRTTGIRTTSLHSFRSGCCQLTTSKLRTSRMNCSRSRRKLAISPFPMRCSGGFSTRALLRRLARSRGSTESNDRPRIYPGKRQG